MQLEFDTADVFTTTRFGGNPLAVVYEAAALETAQMQAIAREFNLAETVFVLSVNVEGARIRIFTPALELPFAGHPNVGTAALLARRLGWAHEAMALDQAAGRVMATLDPQAAGAEITAPQPYQPGEPLDLAAIAACCGLPAEVLKAAQIASCGTPFALAELADAALLAQALPDAAAFRTALPTSRATGVMLYARTGEATFEARMFAPLAGIAEDPATGAAAVALAGLLLARDGLAAPTLRQGVTMGRPSLLALRAWRDGDSIRCAVGGGVVPICQGVITV